MEERPFCTFEGQEEVVERSGEGEIRTESGRGRDREGVIVRVFVSVVVMRQ